jgi:hypothetical protein
MKKTAWVIKVSVSLLVVLSIYALFRMSFIYTEHKIKNVIIDSVNNDLDDFTSYSMKMISEKISSGEMNDFQVQKDTDYPDVINYFYKGKGIGSGSIYYGFYYVPDDNVDVAFNSILEKKDNDSWFYQEKSSDNTMYLEKIKASFYFYKNTY